jgi:hypothetical protein
MNVQQKNLAIWTELMYRGAVVRDDHTTEPRERRRLLLEIANLGNRAEAGGVPRDDWENHELNWIVYLANLRHNLVHSLAEALIKAEHACSREHASANQIRFALRALGRDMRQLLYWWQSEGGREELLGQLPIEERHALEAGKD